MKKAFGQKVAQALSELQVPADKQWLKDLIARIPELAFRFHKEPMTVFFHLTEVKRYIDNPDATLNRLALLRLLVLTFSPIPPELAFDALDAFDYRADGPDLRRKNHKAEKEGIEHQAIRYVQVLRAAGLKRDYSIKKVAAEFGLSESSFERSYRSAETKNLRDTGKVDAEKSFALIAERVDSGWATVEEFKEFIRRLS